MPALVEQQIRVAVKNLLFTTDFSALAETALTYASPIARHYGARVYVGHAIPAEPPLALPGKLFLSNPTMCAKRPSARWRNSSEPPRSRISGWSPF
jgi:nucleotide-binding universal stress UspA family protein